MNREEAASIIAVAAILVWVRVETGEWLIDIFSERLLGG